MPPSGRRGATSAAISTANEVAVDSGVGVTNVDSTITKMSPRRNATPTWSGSEVAEHDGVRRCCRKPGGDRDPLETVRAWRDPDAAKIVVRILGDPDADGQVAAPPHLRETLGPLVQEVVELDVAEFTLLELR